MNLRLNSLFAAFIDLVVRLLMRVRATCVRSSNEMIVWKTLDVYLSAVKNVTSGYSRRYIHSLEQIIIITIL